MAVTQVTNSARLAAVAALLVACLAPTARAGEAAVAVEVDELVSDWALDLQTGRLFASWGPQKVVVEYDPASGKEIRQIEVGDGPRQLVIKGQRLVAAVQTPPSLAVVDLKTNQLVKRIEIGEAAPWGLCCSAVANPYVYCISPTNRADNTIAQIDLEAGKVRHTVSPHQWNVTWPGHMVMSRDGRYMMIDARGRTTHDGVDLIAVREEQGTFRMVSAIWDETGPALPGPANRFWTLGNELYPLDLRMRNDSKDDEFFRGGGMDGEKIPLRKYAGSPTALHPTLDLAFSVRAGKPPQLVVQSFSTALELATVPLSPRHAGIHTRGTSNFVDDPALEVDAERNRVFYGHGRNAFVIDLTSLDLRKQPLVLLSSPSTVDASTDKPVRVPLRLTNPKLQSETKFELLAGPAGAEVDAEGEFHWTPNSGDVGWHLAKVRATVGGAHDQVALGIVVTRPSVPLGLAVTQLDVDPEGRRALVAGIPTSVLENAKDENGIARLDFGGLDPRATQLVLVDLAAGKIVARTNFGKGIASLHLDSDAAYVAPAEGNFFHRLKLADLAPDKRVFVDHPVVGFATLPAGRLAVATQRSMACFSVDKLEPVAVPGGVLTEEDPEFHRWHPFRDLDRPRRPQDEMPVAVDLGGGVLFNGLVLSNQSGQPQWLARGAEVPAVLPGDVDPRDEFLRHRQGQGQADPFRAPRLWSRTLQGNFLYAHTDDPLATLQDAPSMLLTRWPAAVSAVMQWGRDDEGRGGERYRKLSLELRDLVEGKLRETLVLSDGPIDGGLAQLEQFGAGQPQLGAGGDALVVAHLDRLYVVPAGMDRFANYPRPVQIVPRQEPLIAAVGDSVKIKFPTTGGQGEKTLRLQLPVEGVTLDGATGEVEVDTRAVWKQFLEQMEPALAYDEWKQLIEQGRKGYERLLGKSTDNVPFSVEIPLEVRDAEGQFDRLNARVLLLGPHKQLEDRADEIRRRLEQEQAKAAALRAQERLAKAPGSDELVRELGKIIMANHNAETRLRELDRGVADLREHVASVQQALATIEVDGSTEEVTGHAIRDLGKRLDEQDRAMSELQQQLADRSGSQDGGSGNTTLLLFSIVAAGAIASGCTAVAMRLARRTTRPA